LMFNFWHTTPAACFFFFWGGISVCCYVAIIDCEIL
jgi:hypothetical protein